MLRSSFIKLGALLLAFSIIRADVDDTSGSTGDETEAPENCSIAIPKTFLPNSICDPINDFRNVATNEFGFLSRIVSGSSVVFSLDVKKAGRYPVTYKLVGGAPVNAQEPLTMGFLKGRQACPPAGTEGAVYFEKFGTGSWNTAVEYLATSIAFEKGLNQEYTLCFQRAAWVNLNYICIGSSCVTEDIIDASAFIPEPEVPLPAPSNVCNGANIAVYAETNACIEVLCAPDYISLGTPFNMIVRFCNSHPRKYDISLNILDVATGLYLEDFGNGTKLEYSMLDANLATESPSTMGTPSPTLESGSKENNPIGPDGDECGEYTFEITLDPAKISKESIYVWKFLMKPVWYELEDEMVDVYPNVIIEADVLDMPLILFSDNAGTLGDCPVLPSRVFENENNSMMVDIIRFPTKPSCLTPGKSWSIDVDVHIESISMADLRLNLFVGSGPNLYLGEEDLYIAESNVFEIPQNGPHEGADYWSSFTLDFYKKFTESIQPGDDIYVVAFIVQSGTRFNADVKWQPIQLEYNLLPEICDVE